MAACANACAKLTLFSSLLSRRPFFSLPSARARAKSAASEVSDTKRAGGRGVDTFLRRKFFKGRLAATDVAEGAAAIARSCPTESSSEIKDLGKCN
eukprot:3979432-Pyramimonas_sp.AAC.1